MNTMSRDDRVDAIEASVRAYLATGNRDHAGTPANVIMFAAQQLTGYQGASYTDSVYALADRLTTEAEIADLPAKVMRMRS